MYDHLQPPRSEALTHGWLKSRSFSKPCLACPCATVIFSIKTLETPPYRLGAGYPLSLLLFPLDFLLKQTRSLNLLCGYGWPGGSQEQKPILFLRLQNGLIPIKGEQWRCGCKMQRVRDTKEMQSFPLTQEERCQAASLQRDSQTPSLIPPEPLGRHPPMLSPLILVLEVSTDSVCNCPSSLGCLFSLLGTNSSSPSFLYINSQPPLCLTVFPTLVFFSLEMSNTGSN